MERSKLKSNTNKKNPIDIAAYTKSNETWCSRYIGN